MFKIEKIEPVRKNIRQLIPGDVILYLDEQYVFERLPNGGQSIHAVNVNTMKTVRIPVSQHRVGGNKKLGRSGSDYDRFTFDVVGYSAIIGADIKNDVEELVEGDLFAVNHNPKGSYVFRFERYSRTTIIAVNPMNNKEVRISKSFKCTKLGNMPF